jgi:uncharacterized protein YggU (UPF0235/DUF167 family)
MAAGRPAGADPGAAPWRPVPGGLEVRVRVTPRGGRDLVEGMEALSDGRRVLDVRVRAAPEDGAANAAARRVLAEALALPPSAVRLKAGATARLKTFRILGDAGTCARALAALGAESP